MCRKYGADVLINYKESDFSEEVLKATGDQGQCCDVSVGVSVANVVTLRALSSGADVIIDFVGASYWEKNVKSVAVDGRIVMLGMVVFMLCLVCGIACGFICSRLACRWAGQWFQVP